MGIELCIRSVLSVRLSVGNDRVFWKNGRLELECRLGC